MFNISELTGEVNISRGDSAAFSIFINAGTDLQPIQYKLKDKDNLYMAIEEPNQPFEKAIVKKVINIHKNIVNDEGNIIVKISPEDTMCLHPGLFYYEIKARLYRENQYTNDKITYILNDDNTYQIIDCSNLLTVDLGTYETLEEGNITFTKDSGEIFYGVLDEEKGLLTIDEHNYIREDNLVNTLIPRTRFIIEE